MCDRGNRRVLGRMSGNLNLLHRWVVLQEGRGEPKGKVRLPGSHSQGSTPHARPPAKPKAATLSAHLPEAHCHEKRLAGGIPVGHGPLELDNGVVANGLISERRGAVQDIPSEGRVDGAAAPAPPQASSA
jgi:hypothetical protein